MTDLLPAGVVVASNRAAAGVYEDATGPVIVDWLVGQGWTDASLVRPETSVTRIDPRGAPRWPSTPIRTRMGVPTISVVRIVASMSLAIVQRSI